MGTMPSKAAARIAAALKKFQPIIAAQKARDVNESDTVVIVTDVLQEVFGYDKFTEISSEHAIRGTFCDLAIKIDEAMRVLIEVKAIGLELKDNHVKQAVDYAANKGCDWVVLTNAVCWRVYKVIFAKPIDKELVVELNLLELSPRSAEDVELAGLLAREAWAKERLGEYLTQRQAISRFTIAAVLLSDAVLAVIRRELRRGAPNVRIECDEIDETLRKDVIKRECLEGDKAAAAAKLVSKSAHTLLREVVKDDAEPAAAGPSPTKEPATS